MPRANDFYSRGQVQRSYCSLQPLLGDRATPPPPPLP